MQAREILRFGILCRRLAELREWQVLCLKQLLDLPGAEAALVIEAGGDRGGERSRRTKERGIGYALFGRYEKRMLSGSVQAAGQGTIGDELRRLPLLSCQPGDREHVFRCSSQEQLDTISQHHLDFILSLDFPLVQGDLLMTPRYGVWAYRFGGRGQHLGGLPGFWEVRRGDDVAEAVLVRLNGLSAQGTVLYRGCFRTTRTSHKELCNTILLSCSGWPARVCRDLSHGNADYVDGPPSPIPEPVFCPPTNAQMIAFRLKLLWVLCGHGFKGHEKWNVGIVPCPIHQFLASPYPPEPRWLDELTTYRFIADPFGLRNDAGITLLAEEYDYRIGKGWISALTSRDGQSFSEPEPVMEMPIHLAYPYLIEHEGEMHCVPETSDLREVALYRSGNFPEGPWEKVAVLIEDFSVVDATVFSHEGLWWIIGTNKDHDDNAELHAWYADELMGPWKPHEANPIKTDVHNSRPGGTPFVHEGQLYRPAQDCSKVYGGSIVINKVLRLTTTEFKEEEAHRISPDPKGRYPEGLHTISAMGDHTIIDGKRLTFSVGVLVRRILRLLR